MEVAVRSAVSDKYNKLLHVAIVTGKNGKRSSKVNVSEGVETCMRYYLNFTN